jgi:hypothetical protein
MPLVFIPANLNVLVADDVYTFTTIPSDGNIFGAPGSTIGWGYSVTNESTTSWLLATKLGADSFEYGTPTPLFDFPEVAPGATVTESFDPIGLTGLYQDVLNAGTPKASMDSGNFVLSAQWFNGDPFNGGTFIANAIDTSAAYSASVTSTNTVPEPGSAFLVTVGVLAIFVARTRLSRPYPLRIRGE